MISTRSEPYVYILETCTHVQMYAHMLYMHIVDYRRYTYLHMCVFVYAYLIQICQWSQLTNVDHFGSSAY